MSLRETKAQLIRLLADSDNKVIALSGKWGTGKSHLWREIRHESSNDKVKNALYVSLFGLNDLGQIKIKIVQSALPHANERSASWEQVIGALKAGKKALEVLHKGFSALDDLAQLAVPSILKGKVIVLDDIERKHEKLSIDEVLGFIDEFTQQHECRFVLVLNSDQLARREMWDVLREKVVDQELRLQTSSAEAFGIAIGITSSRYADSIKKSVEICGLTNIRIIRKVIKAVNQILGDRDGLDDAVKSRVIPSIAILAAINYKGIEDGPDFQFVLSVGSPSSWSNYLKDEKEELDDQGKREARWKVMLNVLGIYACDEFEALVVEFLESGLFDAGNLSKIIDRYVAETDSMRAREKANEFTRRLFLDHRISEGELLDQAKGLVEIAYLLDPYIVSNLDISLADLPGGPNVGKAIVDEWLRAFREQKHEEINDENPFNQPLHKDIKAEFSLINKQSQAKTTVFDACVYLASNDGWGTKQEIALKVATAADFEMTIRASDIEGFTVFMRQMLKMCSQRQTFDPHFGSATDRFCEACRNIVLDPASGRLGKLIQRLFENAKLGDQIAPPQLADSAAPK